MHTEAGWKVVGVVTEARELKSEKNATWRGYVCKVATLGLTAELQLTPELYKGIADGQYVEAIGGFEDNKGILRLRCSKITAAKEGGAR